MKSVRTFLLAAVLLAFAVPVEAQVRMRMESATPYGTVTGWNVYVGPYRGAMISEPGSPTMDLFCVDFNNSIRVGQEWDANFWNLAGDLGSTRFGAMYGSAARLMYQQAAWLSSQFAVTDQSEWRYIHAAIWQTTSCPSGTCAPSASVGNADVEAWLALATDEDNYSTVNLAEWSVVTDVNTINGTGGVQEYLTRNVVPEPETLILLGTGLLIIGVGVLRRPFG